MAGLLNFTATNYGSAAALPGVSTAVALPGGGGPTLLVSNIGPSPAVVLLGSSSAVTVTPSTGVVVLPNQSLALGVGSNTYIAIMGTQALASLNLAQGT